MILGTSILVIDDDPAALEVIREILEGAGYAAATARDAFQGLRLVREVKPAVVVCDMIMPNMAGSDFFRTLASDPATAKIPRVMISGGTEVDHSSAHDFLAKPFESEASLKSIKKVTSRPAIDSVRATSKEPRWHG